MSIGTANFHPSAIEDKIYDILDSTPEFIVSSKEYTSQAIAAVVEYMNTLDTEWSLIDDMYPNEEGGSVSICWIEDGHLHHIVLNYAYTWDCGETLEDEEEFWEMANKICEEEGIV